MIKETISIDEVIEFLNEASACDADAITQLVTQRVMCSEGLANHPSIQVRKADHNGFYSVGFLGVLNGLFGIDEDGWGPICAIAGEYKIEGFTRTSHELRQNAIKDDK